MAQDPEELLVKALQSLDRGDAARTLTLADQAIAADGALALAHVARAEALAQLGRMTDAEDSFRRALELGEDDAEVLIGAAEFLLMRGEVEEALDLSESAREIADQEGDEQLAAEAALVSAMALNTSGDAQAALEAVGLAREQIGERPDLLVEEGAALFELARFAEAVKSFSRAVKLAPKDAWAHQQLGLVLERTDRMLAEKHFAEARKLAPDDFPAPVELPGAEFDEAVREAVARLPDEIRRHVGEALISVKELPDDEDLRDHEGDHPASPQMLGMFRGASLREKGASGELPPAIFLFQRNLARSAQSREELIEQIRVTVLHEVGHLLGLSEEDLLERGLD